MTLKIQLDDWVDWDVAAYYLAQSLGLMDEMVSFAKDAKHVFWTDNVLGNILHGILNELVSCQVLERRDEPDIQYRWNPSFKGSWE